VVVAQPRTPAPWSPSLKPHVDHEVPFLHVKVTACRHH
jgi:hypothetical protein